MRVAFDVMAVRTHMPDLRACHACQRSWLSLPDCVFDVSFVCRAADRYVSCLTSWQFVRICRICVHAMRSSVAGSHCVIVCSTSRLFVGRRIDACRVWRHGRR